MATILYVEDHPPAQLLMKAIISEMTTHTLYTAMSGAEAMTFVMMQHPDLYIIDLDLPDTDGVRLAAELRKQHPAPVLLVSAYAESVNEADVSAHIFAYLAKPLDPDDVESAIRRTLA
jgi:CheY-like chemotaxis protein